MHQFLTLRGTHLRPPATATATSSGEVTLVLADYSTVAANVPLAIAAKSGFLRTADSGETGVSNHTGYSDHKLDVRERDVFIVSGVAYRVDFVGNRGGYLRTFDLARVVLR